ncbi:MAG: penicillin-binding protein, partial [Thermoleophilia bacterium]|nr:penicillin-binding protein [Thermoleophilia bacterium]
MARGRFPRRTFTWLLRSFVYGTLFLAAVWAGLVTSAFSSVDDLEAKADYRQVQGTVYARDGKTVLRKLRAPETRSYLEAEQLPEVLINAVIAAEDRRFFEHPGIDVRGLARAALVDIRARAAKEGGSTITQQLVKNAYVGPDRSIGRKTREAVLAVALESRWSKERILA